MDLLEKLEVLGDSAKFDVACTSSGSDRKGQKGMLGNAVKAGLCHSFAGDGRCISLLKVLMTNVCIYDCKYCVNRRSNEVQRVGFTPRELADLTIQFYRRNYIEGLFLSSGVVGSPDNTCELMIQSIQLLREEYRFNGYIHAKAIPGADSALLYRLGLLVDRMSVNVELPSEGSLSLLAPDKSRTSIFGPMGMIADTTRESKALAHHRGAPKFAPAGQSTQMIIGATPDSDFQIMRLSESLYQKYGLKRVFYSAYMPVSSDSLLPAIDTKPPLMREHRLYQADWLLRFYGFRAEELLSETNQNLNLYVDPKCGWALSHLEAFPVEINTADYQQLLRVPGIGVQSAQRVIAARRGGPLHFEALKSIGVVLKRAQYFITCGGKMAAGVKIAPDSVLRAMLSNRFAGLLTPDPVMEQLSLFEAPQPDMQEVMASLNGQM